MNLFLDSFRVAFCLVSNGIDLNQTVLGEAFDSIADSRWVSVLLEVLCIDCIELGKEGHISQENVGFGDITEPESDTCEGSLEVFHDLVSLAFDLLGFDVAGFGVDRNLARDEDR